MKGWVLELAITIGVLIVGIFVWGFVFGK